MQKLKIEQNPITSSKKILGLGKIPKKSSSSNSTTPSAQSPVARKSLVDDAQSAISNHKSFKHTNRSNSHNDDKSSHKKLDSKTSSTPLQKLMSNMNNKNVPSTTAPVNNTTAQKKSSSPPPVILPTPTSVIADKSLSPSTGIKRSSPEPSDEAAAKKLKTTNDSSPSLSRSTSIEDKAKDKGNKLKRKSHLIKSKVRLFVTVPVWSFVLG